ncbi:unnamed protein product [Acanthoscelides obtectus]|uniref:Uncharacterized protein n=1 Tax=Acanthoscelides obtectus TaxID=200917 RepID=A0A9P0P4K5_ACAOB|nr:unnamed protein product [Acanthoscelides obtectus]CAK1628095.1 hypothetical protein AOBTE_LOCUS5027 [Acanthoscelides obtectus]
MSQPISAVCSILCQKPSTHVKAVCFLIFPQKFSDSYGKLVITRQETQIALPSENEEGLLEEQVIEEPSPNLTEALAAAVAEIRKVQETITSDSISDHEAFGKFIAASLNKLPAADSIMAQGEIQRVIQKYRLNALNMSSSASEASALTAIQSPTLSWDSPPATTPAYSTSYPVMNEDTFANDDAGIGDIISQAWNLTN